jgi:hypothetical protein
MGVKIRHSQHFCGLGVNPAKIWMTIAKNYIFIQQLSYFVE